MSEGYTITLPDGASVSDNVARYPATVYGPLYEHISRRDQFLMAAMQAILPVALRQSPDEVAEMVVDYVDALLEKEAEA